MPKATSYKGFAREYRPQTFSDLIGQDQIANSLTQQVTRGNVAQAYIFSGPRGVGKTSAARILAKSLDCVNGPTPTPCGHCEQCVSITSGNSMDVIEIDGASNNSVDDVRELQETINQNPFAARRKVYIIDEVHMLSKGAFNALLKTLEEPPDFVIFIFATTELEKIPETIKSRCQVFQFNRISIENIVRRLEYVVSKENAEAAAKGLAGIDVDPENPGYKHILFHPQPGGGLTHAKAALNSMYGLIVSDWRIVKGKFEWDIVVPPNTTATVTLPGEATGREVEAGKYHFSCALA